MERRKADLWMTEYQTPNLRLGLRTRSVLRNLQTPYQHLLVVDTEQYGKVLALDGAIQVTEKDEFTYHEMITHVALCSHPKPVEVLVIGGGDGGSIREILKHQSVKRAVLVDIDEEVIKASRDFFPSLSCSLDDPRVEVRPMDALEYIKNQKGRFDVIIVDSTDPVDFAEGLFKEPFYRDVHGALRDDGMVVAQTESPFAEPILLRNSVSEMKKVFPVVKVFWGAMPTYPTGMWTYTIGSKLHDPRLPLREKPKGTRYYTDEIHRAAFVLPAFLEELLERKGSNN
ncbi:MAG: Spermidine synthase [Synergistales bacterium 53_16]|jgi:spermidine synthase|nr:MAG: Spermidine synthase [Synergistales bacterium 53_16]MDK2845823.1 spermidine synthase [Synergistales bacterium]HAG22996.1 spermidine synthase [Synergistaceae bacterium]